MSIVSNHRILLIDDNREIHADFRKILCPAPSPIEDAEAAFFGESAPASALPRFEVDAACQGDEGVERMLAAAQEGRPYRLAFIDVRMPPGMDGIETAERLWQIAPDLEVVLCTAFADYSWPEINQRLVHRERLLVLKKPFAAIEVLQMACGLSEKWALAQQARERLALTEEAVDRRTEELRAANRLLGEEMEQRKQAEQHLLRAQRLESVGTLASGMAHDLNNSISPILMAAQLLRDDLPRELRDQMLDTIEASAERAAGIVKQVLTFARGSEGEHILLEPKYLVLQIEKIVSGTFPRSITVRSRVAEQLELVRGDSTLLRQVLMNLCLNARDAMRKSGGHLLIEADNVQVDAEMVARFPEAQAGRYMRWRVSDTGAGVPPEALDKLFDPFFTTQELGQGTGLGLSLVASIVKAHDGFVDVRSEIGFGTVFSIYLPAVPEEARAEPASERPPLIPEGKGELVLVVDDEEAIREATTALLDRHGYRVLTASDGVQALSIYREEGDRIKLVVSDLMMPNLDGVELCRALREINPNIRFIASSGYVDDRRLHELEALRLQALLSKPVRSDVLLNTIRDVLKQSAPPEI